MRLQNAISKGAHKRSKLRICANSAKSCNLLRHRDFMWLRGRVGESIPEHLSFLCCALETGVWECGEMNHGCH